MEYHWQYMELVDLCYLGGGQQCLQDCMNLLLKEIILKKFRTSDKFRVRWEVQFNEKFT